MLLHHLPGDAATVRDVRGARANADARWGLTEHLLAHVIDELRYGTYVQRQSRSRKHLPLPRLFERPGVTQPGEKRFGRPQPLAAIRARLRRLNGRR